MVYLVYEALCHALLIEGAHICTRYWNQYGSVTLYQC